MKRLLYYIISLVLVSPLYSIGSADKTNKDVISLEYELSQLYQISSLPTYRSGLVEQESSYDRTGNNDDGFSGKYSYIGKEGNKLILADLKGPGVINRIWTPTPTTDTIQFYIDGEKTPRISIPFIDLFSGKVFPFEKPVCGNEIGGYYCYIPIQYSKSCKIMYVGERIQFHQIQYRTYPKGTKVKSFSMNWTDAEKSALTKACNYWSTQPEPLRTAQDLGKNVQVETKQFFISPGESIPFFESNTGGRVVGMEISCGDALSGANKDIVLQAQWDNDNDLAINSPAADFFGYAYGKPAMQSLVAGYSQGINYCYLPMPYEKKGEMKLVYKNREGEAQPKIEINTKVYYTSDAKSENEGRLYTAWRREINPKDFEPYLMADIEDEGHYVGIVHLAQGLRPGMTLFFEGDDSIVVDNKMRIHGTGSEDFYNGGWYALLDRWDRGVSLPIHGSLDYSLPMCRTGAYRFFLSDKMTFENNFRLTIEHGPENNLFPVDYTSVAFYYGSKPNKSVIDPTEKLRTVYYPTEHVYFPQLMNLSLGGDTQIENRGRLVLATGGQGEVRIMLNEIPEGLYKIRLNYFETPDGGQFAVWNRQKLVADWVDVNASKENLKEKAVIGEVYLTRHTNSLTIKVKKTEKGNKFHFDQLFLEKQ
jgi:hypothetical protein